MHFLTDPRGGKRKKSSGRNSLEGPDCIGIALGEQRLKEIIYGMHAPHLKLHGHIKRNSTTAAE